jgi:hypothetical protein
MINDVSFYYPTGRIEVGRVRIPTRQRRTKLEGKFTGEDNIFNF